MQAESTIQKGVEEWNPKEDPHAQVQLLMQPGFLLDTPHLPLHQTEVR